MTKSQISTYFFQTALVIGLFIFALIGILPFNWAIILAPLWLSKIVELVLFWFAVAMTGGLEKFRQTSLKVLETRLKKDNDDSN